MKKIYRIFGVKILEVETLSQKEAETKQLLKSHDPEGVILDVSQEELDKEKDQETIRRMEGK